MRDNNNWHFSEGYVKVRDSYIRNSLEDYVKVRDNKMRRSLEAYVKVRANINTHLWKDNNN